MKKIYAITVLLLSITWASCSSAKQDTPKEDAAIEDAHTSQSSLDWAGNYKGMLPCADCEGISMVVQLSNDNTYQIHQKYEGKSGSVETSSGNFVWEDNGNIISLKINNETRKFQVGENKLFWLDNQGERITGDLANNYILSKEENALAEKYWKLVRLMDDPITTTEGAREAHIILKQEGNRLVGNGSCNAISGTYTLKEREGISFTNISSTDMACKALITEENLIQVLQKADSYLLKGDTLFLHKGRMAPLARFEAVYLK